MAVGQGKPLSLKLDGVIVTVSEANLRKPLRTWLTVLDGESVLFIRTDLFMDLRGLIAEHVHHFEKQQAS